jgi:hypothetical protein
MARLLIRTEGLQNRTLELRLGVNRVGRTPDNDFQIPHTTVSSHHCEFVVTNDGVYLRDCDSTNGSFLNGVPVKETWLAVGQEVRLGKVELLVETTEVNIAIPKYERPPETPPPPAVLADGTAGCARHPELPAIFRCPHCGQLMCQNCIHVMKRQGGAPLFLCNLCSHKCERITTAKPVKKRGFLGFLQETVKLKFGPPRGGAGK